jgi:hypothetical protein
MILTVAKTEMLGEKPVPFPLGTGFSLSTSNFLV